MARDPSRKQREKFVPLQSVPWLDDPDEPDRMTPEQMDRMVEGIAKRFPELVENKEKAFDPSQPRDEQGRWSDGGGDGGEQAEAKPASTPDPKTVLKVGRQTAKELGFDPDKISIGETPTTKTLLGREMTAAAVAYGSGAKAGRIEIFPEQIPGMNELPGIVAHEVTHQKFQASIDRALEERDAGGGPVYDAMREAMFAHPEAAFAAADGVSNYSRAYWEAWLKDEVDMPTAMHETLAEMARLRKETGKFPDHQGGDKSDAMIWRKLYRTVDKLYKEELS